MNTSASEAQDGRGSDARRISNAFFEYVEGAVRIDRCAEIEHGGRHLCRSPCGWIDLIESRRSNQRRVREGKIEVV